MKNHHFHYLLAILFMVSAPTRSRAQETYYADSPPIMVRIIPAGEVEKKYGREIEAEAKASPLFAPKDEFETQAQYQQRLEEGKKFRETVVAKYRLRYEQFLKEQYEQKVLAAEEKTRKIKNSLVEESFLFESFGTYDPEQQQFAVRIKGKNYSLKVPLAEAKTFKENISTATLRLDKQLLEDGLTWDYFNFRITHPITGSTYLLNEKKPLYQEARIFAATKGSGGVPRVAASVSLIEPSGNKILDAGESATIQVTVANEGTGAATLFRAQATAAMPGVTVEKEKTIGDLIPGKTQTFVLQIKADRTVSSGECSVSLQFFEGNGFQPAPLQLTFNTQAFRPPQLAFIEARIKDNGNGNNVIENSEIIDVTILIQNKGQGKAENVKSVIKIENPDVIPTTPEKMELRHGALESGESKTFSFSFVVNNNYKGSDVLPIKIILSESDGQYGATSSLGLEMKKVSLVATAVKVEGNFDTQKEIKVASLSSDVDVNIPSGGVANKNRFALIIGNENYSRYQTGLEAESNVAFAVSDAQVFSKYAEKVLGVPKENIFLHTDIISSRMKQEIDKLSKLSQYSNGEAELIFFYAGHGFPDELTKEPYLIPVDISGAAVRDGVRLSELYNKLTQFPARRVTVFLDACFSGGGREAGLLAARGVKIKAKEEPLKGNLVVFSASSGTQTSLPYREKMHGMFTYFLLKKLQETGGNLSYDVLADYIRKEVQLNSIRVNSKDQNPEVLVSPELKEAWRLWLLKK